MKENNKLEADDLESEKEKEMYKKRRRSEKELRAIHAKIYKPRIYKSPLYKVKIYKPPNYNPKNPIPRDIVIKYPKSSPSFGPTESLDQIIKKLKKKSQW